jgi:hypothetical protein
MPDHIVQQANGRVIEQMGVVDDDGQRCRLTEQMLDRAPEGVRGAHVDGQHRGHRSEWSRRPRNGAAAPPHRETGPPQPFGDFVGQPGLAHPGRADERGARPVRPGERGQHVIELPLPACERPHDPRYACGVGRSTRSRKGRSRQGAHQP